VLGLKEKESESKFKLESTRSNAIAASAIEPWALLQFVDAVETEEINLKSTVGKSMYHTFWPRAVAQECYEATPDECPEMVEYWMQHSDEIVGAFSASDAERQCLAATHARAFLRLSIAEGGFREMSVQILEGFEEAGRALVETERLAGEAALVAEDGAGMMRSRVATRTRLRTAEKAAAGLDGHEEGDEEAQARP